jgi:hypothetical protein
VWVSQKELTGEVERCLTFYCKHVRVPYEPLLAPAVGALVALGWREPAGVVARFHFICSSFMPFLLMNPAAR